MIYDKVVTTFEEVPFTTTELIEIQKHLASPIIKKYFYSLATSAIKDLVHSIRKDGETAESFLERRAVTAGGLATIEQLLAIEPVKVEE